MNESPISQHKIQLRATLRRRRAALDDNQQRNAAQRALAHLQVLPAWPSARRVALYLARDGELDTTPVIEHCRETDRQLFLPVLSGKRMSFRLWQAGVALVDNNLGIGEPPAAAPGCEVTDLDLVLVPLVGFDRRGHRLGMGGGFYDRTFAPLSGRRPLRVGLAHALQEVARVPTDDWDVPLHGIVTDQGLVQV
jgi:5-formyltetrahydrofolate cyclo-ligase